MTRRLLALDIGQSGLRALVADGEQRHLRSDPVGTVAALDQHGITRLVERIHLLIDAGHSPDVCVIGLTGFVEDDVLMGDLERRVGDAVGAGRVVIVSDVVAAYTGCLVEQPGATLIWGTGAVALAADGAGGWARVDGRGYALGDQGSGYWIGHRGLVAALDHLDGRGGSAALASRAARLGTPDEIYRTTYAAPSTTQVVAAFVSAVVDAASEGDEVADLILDGASDEVARTITGAARILPTDVPLTVGLTGGLSRVDDLVERLRSRLETETGKVHLRIEPGAPLEGALHLATRPELRHAFPGLVYPRIEAA